MIKSKITFVINTNVDQEKLFLVLSEYNECFILGEFFSPPLHSHLLHVTYFFIHCALKVTVVSIYNSVVYLVLRIYDYIHSTHVKCNEMWMHILSGFVFLIFRKQVFLNENGMLNFECRSYLMHNYVLLCHIWLHNVEHTWKVIKIRSTTAPCCHFTEHTDKVQGLNLNDVF